jgi:hypothetical protein
MAKTRLEPQNAPEYRSSMPAGPQAEPTTTIQRPDGARDEPDTTATNAGAPSKRAKPTGLT